MMKGLVSVIICCFNGARFIDRCFCCLMQQTCRTLEVVFVDDGSEDDSFRLASGYVPEFTKLGFVLKCFSQEHKGAGSAAATGLRLATGEYISCYDVDDILYPESIDKRKRFLEQHQRCSLVRTNGYKVSADGLSKTLFVTDAQEKAKEDIFEDLLLGKTNNWAGSYMVRAESLWHIYPDREIPESRYGQNLQILMAVAWQNKAGFIDEPLMEYRMNPSSFTNSDTSFRAAYERLMGYKGIRLDILEKLGIKDCILLRELDKTYACLVLDLCIRHQKESEYLDQYARLAAMGPPAFIYQYYFHLFKGEHLQALIFRIASSKTIGQMIRFGFVGIVATIIHYSLYLGLKAIIPITIAYIIGYSVSFFANYYLTARFTFQRGTSPQTGAGFLCAHLFNLALQAGLLNLFVHFGIRSSLAPIPVFAIAIPVNFLLVRRVFTKAGTHFPLT